MHLGTLLLVPLMAVVVYLLLREIEGSGARVARLVLRRSPGGEPESRPTVTGREVPAGA